MSEIYNLPQHSRHLMLTQADVCWIELDSVDSTNDYLVRAYQQGRVSGHVAVLAHQQTQGRGRAGRRWLADPGASLCLSVGLPLAGHQLPGLPLCVGIAVAKVLENLGVPVGLKWPNDLMVQSRKLGGVLCESFQTGAGAFTVIGLGVNLRPVQLPDAMGGRGTTCLADWLDGATVPDPLGFAQTLVPAILDQIAQSQRHGMVPVFQQFTRLDVWLGHEVQVLDQGVLLHRGVARGIDEQGAYLVETSQGLRAVHAGDLSLRVAP